MWKDKLVLIPGLITLIVLLAGTALSVTALYGWHLAIHPEPQLDRSIGPVLRRTEGIAALVAVASRREDAAALGFNAKVHGRDCSPPPPAPDRGPAWLVSPRRRCRPGSGGARG